MIAWRNINSSLGCWLWLIGSSRLGAAINFFSQEVNHIEQEQRLKGLAVASLDSRHILQPECKDEDSDCNRDQIKSPVHEVTHVENENDKNEWRPNPSSP